MPTGDTRSRTLVGLVACHSTDTCSRVVRGNGIETRRTQNAPKDYLRRTSLTQLHEYPPDDVPIDLQGAEHVA